MAPTRTLPAAELLFQDPAPRPTIKKGDDARLLARKALSYGDSNADRLNQAREAYEAVRRIYMEGQPP